MRIIPRKRWEVYRTVPASWATWKPPGDYRYGIYWLRRNAESVTNEADAILRNGRDDADFAAFNVRKI